MALDQTPTGPTPVAAAQTLAAIGALSTLVDDCRTAARRARRARQHALLTEIRRLGNSFDAARTRIVQDGADYLPTAWAFVDAGRRTLSTYLRELDVIDLGIDRIAAERTTADDVIAWLDHNGIHVYPWQRRSIERLFVA
ncbi:hypothetical protein K8F61_18640 [Microbacterium resistens]|uniref:DUF222 domain-containing protein n=1 Tax=Microbacterium resistens TaxID=156977 RepID=A0ABY3RRB1_9MICO|nr:hypothetical protein [Microbacterium resistens]UGS26604.1 hypothetical protein K8F61_18640 [Microbacterium resistens]